MSTATGNKRPRPVITVVAARPLSEVGFRDAPAKPSTQPNAAVQMRKAPDRPGAPPAKTSSWRRSMPPSVAVDNTQHDHESNNVSRPSQAPLPTPRASLANRPLSMIDRIPGPPKIVPSNDYEPVTLRSGFDNNAFETNSQNNIPEASLINFDDAGSSCTKTSLTLQVPHSELSKAVDDEPMYAVVNKPKKTDINQNHDTMPAMTPPAPPIPARTVDDQHSESTVEAQNHSHKTAKDIGAHPTPLAFLNSEKADPFPVLRKTVYPNENPSNEEQKNNDESNESITKKNIFAQGIPVFPLAPGFTLQKTTEQNAKPHRQARPWTMMGPPTAAKPKPGLKPKPAVKPKPAIKPKPSSLSAPVTPCEPSQQDIGSSTLTKPEPNLSVNRPQSMLVLPTDNTDEDIARQTKDQEASVSNIISAMRARLEHSQTESSASKPMKATYRPTIIRPQVRKDCEEDNPESKKLLPKNNQDDVPTLLKPTLSGPVRNRPTIIRTRGTSTQMAEAETEPETNQDQPRNDQNSRLLSSAVSMPNLAATKMQNRTEAHNWHGMGSPEEHENATNDMLAAELGGYDAGKMLPGRPPNYPVARQQVLSEASPEQSSPLDYEEINYGSAHNISVIQQGNPPPRPTAAPRGESSDNIRQNSKPPPRPLAGPCPPRQQAGPQAGKSDGRHNVQPETGPLPTKHLPVTKSTCKQQGPPPELPVRPGPEHPLFHYVVDEPHGIALYDYEASHSDEISFKSGDVIILLSEVNEEWMLGCHKDIDGIFPTGFVHVVKSPTETTHKAPTIKKMPRSPQTQRSDSGSGPRCVARFDYEGEEEDDLTFQSDDVIKLLERIDDEWVKGEINGKTGIFPASYVEIIEDLPPAKSPAVESEIGNMVTARHDFNGEVNELSFKKGARIHILSQLNADWLFGELDSKKGSFPASFVDRIPSDLPKMEAISADSDSKATSKSKPARVKSQSDAYCVATYDYAGDGPDDLQFQKGQTIMFIEHVNDDWLKGSLDDRVGIFPKGFVDIMKDVDELPPRPGQDSSLPKLNSTSVPKAIAKYDFAGETDSDLSFTIGEEIVLLDKAGMEWFKGCIGDREGMFPAAFVEVIVPL